jgi:hypothetical protein
MYVCVGGGGVLWLLVNWQQQQQQKQQQQSSQREVLRLQPLSVNPTTLNVFFLKSE